jgi:hypothetical protein
MTENATLAGRERPPEEGIQSRPKPVAAGRPLDLRDNITRYPELVQLGGQEGRPGSQPLGSEPSDESSRLGCASLILGVVTICFISFGFLLVFTGIRSPATFVAVYGSFCFGTILSLPGVALGMASLARKGRSNSAGVLGCSANGLILGAWLLLFAVVLFIDRWHPRDSNPTAMHYTAPYDPTDFWRR